MNLLAKVKDQWKNYKYRFVPWIMLNMSENNTIKSSVQATSYT